MSGIRHRSRGRALAWAAALLALLAAPAAAQLTGGALYAHCTGITDGMFAHVIADDDRSEMDYWSDEAHIFMALARRASGAPGPGVLRQLRVEAAAQLFHDGATDDSIHALVQECSDLQQALTSAGKFRETP